MFDDIFPMLATQQMELDAIDNEIADRLAAGETTFTIDLDDYSFVSEWDIMEHYSND